MKIVKIVMFTETGEIKGIWQANKFLESIPADDVIDVKLSAGNEGIDILIVYKTEKDR